MAGSFACKSNAGVAPQEQLLGTMAGNRRLSIGLPAEHNGGEKRFPLTPEGVALLTKEGYRVFVEVCAGLRSGMRHTLFTGIRENKSLEKCHNMRLQICQKDMLRPNVWSGPLM